MWKKISENYEASTDGHIRNAKTKHVLHEYIGKDGYLRTQFDGKTRTVHRVIAKAFLEQNEGKPYINHKDGVKTNNNVNNLEWCTASENQRHAYKLGLKNANHLIARNRKLSDADVQYIRKHYVKGDPIFGALALAERYNVTHQAICEVAHGRAWKKMEDTNGI